MRPSNVSRETEVGIECAPRRAFAPRMRHPNAQLLSPRPHSHSRWPVAMPRTPTRDGGSMRSAGRQRPAARRRSSRVCGVRAAQAPHPRHPRHPHHACHRALHSTSWWTSWWPHRPYLCCLPCLRCLRCEPLRCSFHGHHQEGHHQPPLTSSWTSLCCCHLDLDLDRRSTLEAAIRMMMMMTDRRRYDCHRCPRPPPPPPKPLGPDSPH